MKGFAVILVLAIFGLGSVSTTSCLVTRRSESFACTTTSDCDNGRSCENGYCVLGACPSPCTSCDLAAKTCKIECSASKPCGAVQCPAGFDCTIRCSNANACSDIDCAQGSNCTIECAGPTSCGPINCGMEPCDISCSGASACPQIDCVSSCKCDVECNSTSMCPSIACPLNAIGNPCSPNGIADEPCDSTAGPACSVCL